MLKRYSGLKTKKPRKVCNFQEKVIFGTFLAIEKEKLAIFHPTI
jgi:hypothetical protein